MDVVLEVDRKFEKEILEVIGGEGQEIYSQEFLGETGLVDIVIPLTAAMLPVIVNIIYDICKKESKADVHVNLFMDGKNISIENKEILENELESKVTKGD